jgi:hypothetical protein
VGGRVGWVVAVGLVVAVGWGEDVGVACGVRAGVGVRACVGVGPPGLGGKVRVGWGDGDGTLADGAGDTDDAGVVPHANVVAATQSSTTARTRTVLLRSARAARRRMPFMETGDARLSRARTQP